MDWSAKHSKCWSCDPPGLGGLWGLQLPWLLTRPCLRLPGAAAEPPAAAPARSQGCDKGQEVPVEHHRALTAASWAILTPHRAGPAHSRGLHQDGLGRDSTALSSTSAAPSVQLCSQNTSRMRTTDSQPNQSQLGSLSIPQTGLLLHHPTQMGC